MPEERIGPTCRIYDLGVWDERNPTYHGFLAVCEHCNHRTVRVQRANARTCFACGANGVSSNQLFLFPDELIPELTRRPPSMPPQTGIVLDERMAR